MNKLQAIRYFLRVVEAGSFSAAARQLEVSPPAVTKLVAALEREIGTVLLHRDAHHVALTPDGESYLKTCSRIVAELQRTEQLLGAGRTNAAGKLVVGMSRVLGPNCVMPFISEFIGQHPETELDFRLVHYPHEPSAGLCDVLVLIGWHHDTDWIARPIAATRFVTCAAPAYWDRHGMLADPNDLLRHQCLVHRVPNGVVLDLWRYTRNDTSRTVALRPSVIADDRDALVEAAATGAGIIRMPDLTIQPWLTGKSLQAALQDWTALEAPPIHVFYRRGNSQSARVRVFREFIGSVFERIALQQGYANFSTGAPKPEWFRAGYAGGLAARESLSTRKAGAWNTTTKPE